MAIHALLVGINQYHPGSGVSPLNGCVNDVLTMQAYLNKRFSPDQQQIKQLINQDATRNNVITAFKTNLIGKQVRDDDIVLFYYGGHGSYAPSAPAFAELRADTKEQDETLVLYDSRLGNNFDLADKELALLLAAVNQSASIVVILDSCHSGSATRSVNMSDGIKLGLPRFTPASKAVSSRSLDQYLSVDGFDYNKMAKLEIPISRHILLAACGRDELAYEAVTPNGMFTGSLVKLLEQLPGNITYTGLYQNIYALIKRMANKQTPQLKIYGGSNPNLCFLSKEELNGNPTYQVSFNGQEWTVNYGALHGMPGNEKILSTVKVALYNNSGTLAGIAAVIKSRLVESVLRPEIPMINKEVYAAEILNQPPSLCIYVRGDKVNTENFFAISGKQQAGRSEIVFHHDESSYHDVILDVSDNEMRIEDATTKKLLHGISKVNESTIDYITKALMQIGKWKTFGKMQHSGYNIREGDIVFNLQIQSGNGQWKDCEEDDLTFDLTKERPEIPFRIKLSSLSPFPYYVALYRLSPGFAIEKYTNDVDASILTTDKVPAIECNTPEGSEPYAFLIDSDLYEETEIYKLIASKGMFYDYFVEERNELEPRVLDEIPGRPKGVKPASKGDWMVKTITIRLVKKYGQLSFGR